MGEPVTRRELRRMCEGMIHDEKKKKSQGNVGAECSQWQGSERGMGVRKGKRVRGW